MKHDTDAIFRSNKSGLNEELVYKPESTCSSFFPVLAFPNSDELLAACISPNAESKITLYKINVPAHQSVALGEISGNLDLAWAEAGKTVVFSRTVNGITNIWQYSLQDRSLKPVTSGAGPDFSPMPDPNGKGIYFVNGKSTSVLTAYHVVSKQFTEIVSEEASQPIISPDGKRVMYIELSETAKHELWVSDIDGTNKVKLASGDDMETGGWAHDNFHLSFHQKGQNAPAAAYVIGADGSGLLQLPRTGNRLWNSVWDRDQQSIYLSGRDADSAPGFRVIWRVSVDGSNREKIITDCGAVSDVDPSGKYTSLVSYRPEKRSEYTRSPSPTKSVSRYSPG